MIGKKILNYEIKKLLGEGGMGNVYLAEHTQLGRKVAIKSLHQQLVKNDGLRMRFKNEAATMAHLQHPKIVALYDYVEEEDGLFLVMEYVEGLPLDEYIREKSGPIPSETAVPMMIQILEAFSYAHNKGIVHRDIKPSNILITDNGEIKILDFGIAKMMSEAGNKLTKTGTQMGTVFYMSPEQVQGKEVDLRSDIYSLGVTFYQMLTGISPYDGLTTEYEVYSKIVTEPLPTASYIYPGVPDYLDKVILKATAKNKEDRFQTCEEFSKTLSKGDFQDTVVKNTNQTISGHSELKNKTTSAAIPPPVKTKNESLKSLVIAVVIFVVLSGVIVLMNYSQKSESYESSGSQPSGSDEPISNEPAAEAPAPADYQTDLQSYESAKAIYQRFSYAVVNQNETELLACFAPTLRVWHSSTNKQKEQIVEDFNVKYFSKWDVIEDNLLELTELSNKGEFNYKKKYTIVSTSNRDNTIEYNIYGYFVVNPEGQIIEMKDTETNRVNEESNRTK